ncbi:MAG TPA: hypothetical protein GXX14_01510 [Clostridiaceae bacterium]|nr:hypothetical protein [Clostridiaceae bacterium]
MNNKNGKITSKNIIYSVLEGRKPERNPVAVPYVMLAHEDHWTELTGEPTWRFYEWLLKPEEHGKYYRAFDQKLPFDIFQPARYRPGQDTTEFRENTEVVIKDGQPFFHFKKEDKYEKLALILHGADSVPNEKQFVFDKGDINEMVKIESAETQLARGQGDYIKACVQELGNERFILSGGILNVFYLCSWYVGLTNLFTMVYDNPALIEYLSKKLLEQNIERIRMLAASGGDAIYIDDAMTTCDMISPEMYEKCSLPYIKEEIKEIHRLGKKAVVIYFGGISDRVDLIASSGADAMIMEASMKGFTNDYEDVSKKLAGKMCLFTNLNPYDDLEITSDEELRKVVSEMAQKAKKYGRYVISTGSPVTPGTTLARLNRFIELGRSA